MMTSDQMYAMLNMIENTFSEESSEFTVTERLVEFMINLDEPFDGKVLLDEYVFPFLHLHELIQGGVDKRFYHIYDIDELINDKRELFDYLIEGCVLNLIKPLKSIAEGKNVHHTLRNEFRKDLKAIKCFDDIIRVGNLPIIDSIQKYLKKHRADYTQIIDKTVMEILLKGDVDFDKLGRI